MGLFRKALVSWRRRPAAPAARVFRIACACGGEALGRRTKEDQQVACPRCGRLVYVLADSAWPPLAPPEALPVAAAMRARAQARRLLVMLMILVVLLAALTLTRAPGWLASAPELEQSPGWASWQAARESAGVRDWEAAERHARRALRELGGWGSPQALAARHALTELLLGLEALCDLAPRSLEAIVAEARQTPYADWPRRWRAAYEGRTIAWRLAGVGGAEAWEGRYAAEVDGAPFVIDWNLRPVERAGLGEPGADSLVLRLESCRLEEAGGGAAPVWVVRFQANSLQALRAVRLQTVAGGWLESQRRRGQEAGAGGGPSEVYGRLREALAGAAPGAAPGVPVPSPGWQVQQVWAGGFRECAGFAAPPEPRLMLAGDWQAAGARVREAALVRKPNAPPGR